MKASQRKRGHLGISYQNSPMEMHSWSNVRPMADTKQTKTIGEHHVASELARRGWAPAMTRDGIERTDILAVMTNGEFRRLVEIQVKAARGPKFEDISWPIGTKAQDPISTEHEFFVLVAIPDDLELAPRSFVVPRRHISAGAWIEHMKWLTDPDAKPGKRNAGPDRARTSLQAFASYEDRWDLLLLDQCDTPVLLPPEFRLWSQLDAVGLPERHPWRDFLPDW